MKVIVTGGREFDRRNHLFYVMDELHAKTPITLLIHGDSKGADKIAEEWANRKGIEVLPCPADWITHGKAAGPIRNREMLEHKPDLVVAFAGGKGTANMVKQAEQAGVEVYRA